VGYLIPLPTPTWWPWPWQTHQDCVPSYLHTSLQHIHHSLSYHSSDSKAGCTGGKLKAPEYIIQYYETRRITWTSFSNFLITSTHERTAHMLILNAMAGKSASRRVGLGWAMLCNFVLCNVLLNIIMFLCVLFFNDM
jgi:hypothetical protein